MGQGVSKGVGGVDGVDGADIFDNTESGWGFTFPGAV